METLSAMKALKDRGGLTTIDARKPINIECSTLQCNSFYKCVLLALKVVSIRLSLRYGSLLKLNLTDFLSAKII